MRSVLLLSMSLYLTGCWKTIHEASAPSDRAPVVLASPRTTFAPAAPAAPAD